MISELKKKFSGKAVISMKSIFFLKTFIEILMLFLESWTRFKKILSVLFLAILNSAGQKIFGSRWDQIVTKMWFLVFLYFLAFKITKGYQIEHIASWSIY